MPRYILGIHRAPIASACLMADGEVCAAVDGERIARWRAAGGDTAIDYVLQSEGITIDDVELMVQDAPSRGRGRAHGPRVVTISRHLAGAYGAAASCSLDGAAVLVTDSGGSTYSACTDLSEALVPEAPPGELADVMLETLSYYQVRGARLEATFKDFSVVRDSSRDYVLLAEGTRHSLVGVGEAISRYVFAGHIDLARLAALAARGDAMAEQAPIFDLRGGRIWVRDDWADSLRCPARSAEDHLERFEELAELAARWQSELERALLYSCNELHQRWPAETLCLAGVLGENRAALARLAAEGPFADVIAPQATRPGAWALGCASYGWRGELGEAPRPTALRPLSGRCYRDDDIEECLAQFSDWLVYERHQDITEPAAEALASGRVVAWFQGGAELGPLPRGQRAILVDAQSSEGDALASADVMEPYLPLAITLAAENVDSLGGDVRSGAAVVPISADGAPLFHRLHQAFAERTGRTTLVNAPFSTAGSAVVETPEDAVSHFVHSDADALAIGSYFVERAPADETLAAIGSADDFLDAFQAVVEAGATWWDLEGVVNLKLEDAELTWTFSCDEDGPAVAPGAQDDADFCFSLDERSLVEVFNVPDRIPYYIDNGKIAVLGCPASARAKAGDVLTAWMRFARIDPPDDPDDDPMSIFG